MATIWQVSGVLPPKVYLGHCITSKPELPYPIAMFDIVTVGNDCASRLTTDYIKRMWMILV
jgi:hypothetical protein